MIEQKANVAQYNPTIDVMNIAACIAVVALHVNGGIWGFARNLNWAMMLITECVCHWAVPVFFMIILGMIARIKGFISPEQKEGANHIVFNVLFPILIFNVLFTAKIESSAILIVLYVLIAFTLALVLGKCITKFTDKEVGHISPYLLTTFQFRRSSET